MKDRQWGSLFFSILDTRKVLNLVLDLFNIVQNNLQPQRQVHHLVLAGCNLTSTNSAVLASAVATIRSVDLSDVQFQPQQVAKIPSFWLQFFSKVVEVLRKSASAKGLFYLSLDGVQVPEELLNDKVEDAILSKMRTRYNMYIGGSTTSNTLTSVIQ